MSITLLRFLVHREYYAMKLGRVPSPLDPRTLRLSNYLDVASLPPAPPTVSWCEKVANWGVMLNDRIGCCTIAAAGHLIQQWTAWESGSPATVTDRDILNAYAAVSGYNGRPWTDRGANMLEALKFWRATGIGGHKGVGYVSVDPRNLDQVKAALWIFGGLYGGCTIYRSWMSGAWDTTAGGPAGGHAWELCGWRDDGFRVVSWGKVYTFTWRGWQASMVSQPDAELYAVLSPDWTAVDGISSSGFRIHDLENDLAILGGQPLPHPPAPIPTPPAPEPTPTPTPNPPVGPVFADVAGSRWTYQPGRWVAAS